MIVVFVGVLTWTTRSAAPDLTTALRESTTIRTISSLLRSPSSRLEGERDDRITMLLLGMGGFGHDGPLLTDTIAIASVQPSTGRAALIALPRDLLIPLEDGSMQKVNAVNAYAETSTGRGAHTTREALAELLDIPIPYHIRVDFAGFVGLIDDLGGITVNVERRIDDPRYPIEGNEDAEIYEDRFEHLVIPAGRQTFDGALALKYVRSRHSLGAEGSDFARTRRQQQLLAAVRDRTLENGVLANPRKILALLRAWNTNVQTNLTPPELYRLSRIAIGLNEDTIERVVFSAGPDGELSADFYNGTYVLRPRTGNFDAMRARVASATRESREPEKMEPLRVSPVTPSIAPQPPETTTLLVNVWNGTTTSGLAGRIAETLEEKGFRVDSVQNAPQQTVQRSIVYHRASVPVSVVVELQELFNADASTAFPAINAASTNSPDILIVLGTSST
jgi:LCP family protein required for cell wall assembly